MYQDPRGATKESVTSDGAKRIEALFALDQLNATINKVEKMMDDMPPFSAKRKEWSNCMESLYELRLLLQKELRNG